MNLKAHIYQTILFCLLVLATGAITPAFGQIDSRNYTASLYGDIELLDERLSGITIDTGNILGCFSSISMTLVNGELVIDYTLLEELPKELINNTYYVSVQLFMDGDHLILRPDDIYGDHGAFITSTSGFDKQFVVSNLIERHVNLSGKLEVELNVVHEFELNPSFPFSCSEGRPSFTGRQKVPYIAGAVAGTGLVIWGAITEVEAQKLHDDYWRYVNKDNAQPLYEDANSKHKLGVGLMVAGGAVLAADAVFYFLRKNDYKRRKYMFETYCEDGKSVSYVPLIKMPDISSPDGSAGVAIIYTF